LVIWLKSLIDSEGEIGPVDVGTLYRRCVILAESQSLPFPKSAQGFGKHLSAMKRVIEIELGTDFAEERGAGNKRYVSIRPKQVTEVTEVMVNRQDSLIEDSN